MTYTESDAVRQARKKKEQTEAARPADYTSQWRQQQEEALGKLLDRKDFAYDLNADALYQQYRDAYARQGRRAMEDTMGTAAALTGGYGNSYAQTAGQMAYQDYLEGLNSRVPELYQLALERYTQEGEDLRQNYDLLTQREAQDYSRYRDALEEWLTERDYQTGVYTDERDTEYDRWADSRDYAYQVARDQEKDRQWQAEFDYQAQQDALSWEAKNAAASSGGGGGGGSRKKSDTDAASQTSASEDKPTLPQVLAAIRRTGDSKAVKQTKIDNTIREALNRGEIDTVQAAKYKRNFSRG